MNSNQRTEARALADRCVNYADALTAIVYLGVSGLGVALIDPDARHSLNNVTGWIIAGNIALCMLISALLMVLRRWELDLRSGEPQDAAVVRYSRYFNSARHCVVWLSLLQITVILLVATLDR